MACGGRSRNNVDAVAMGDEAMQVLNLEQVRAQQESPSGAGSGE